MKLLIWSPIPTHHQSALFQALRDRGVDLVVHYYLRVPEERIQLGWVVPEVLPDGERYVAASASSVDTCTDWRQRVHVLPGYAYFFLLVLALRFSVQHVPWVHWSESSNPNKPGRWATNVVRRWHAGLINRYALGALAISELAQRDFVRWGVRSDRIRIVPYGIAPVSAPAGLRSPNRTGPMRFLFLGELCENKAIDVLLTAFAEVQRRSPSARLLLVGRDTSQGRFARMAADLRLESVSFRPSVPAIDVGKVIAECDVLVLPSRHDGWGMVLSEGASMARALIASDACGAAYHVIEDGVAGFRVPVGDPKALARRMIEYCESPELAAVHGEASRKLFERLLPPEIAVRMCRAIEQLAARDGGVRQSMRLT